MARRYCECGRKILVYKSKGRSGVKQAKRDHELCQKCWESERDSQYRVPEMRRITKRSKDTQEYNFVHGELGEPSD